MSRSERNLPRVMAVAPTGQPPARTAEIIELPSEAIGRNRHQRVKPLTRAYGDQAPDLRARKAKQTEKQVEGLPNVVEITYRTGRRVWFLRYIDPLTGNWTSAKLGVVGVMPFIEMAALAKRWQDDIALGRSPKASKMRVDAFVEREFEPWAREHQRSYRDTLARYSLHLQSHLGDKALGEITQGDIERIVALLRHGNCSMRRGQLSNASINRALMAARAIFRLAVERQYISSNPVKGVRQLKETPPSPKALESEELDRLFAALAGESLQFVLLIRLLLCTGARINEILMLKHTDIDDSAGVMHLRTTKAGEHQTLPKTPVATAILRELETLRRPGNDHLFPARSGTGPIAPPYKKLRKLLADAGLERAGFHLFRKTVATQAMTLPGMDVLTVSRMLRHKSVRTLEVHYLATPQKRLRQAANDVGELLQARLQRRADTR